MLKYKTKFDMYLLNFILSMIVMMALFYPTGIAHELGHGVICWSEGGSFPLDWVFTRLAVLCDPFPVQKELSWAMGGIFGMIASVIPPFVFRFLRKWNVILNGFLGCAFLQLGYAISESQKNTLYKVNDLEALLPIVLMGTFSIIFFTLYIEKIQNYLKSYNQTEKQ